MNDETPAQAYRAALAGTETDKLNFRKRIAPRTHYSDERQDVAFQQALAARAAGELELAETWALRALHDGPSRPAFALLGDICEETADLQNARRWYLMAAAMQEPRRFDDPEARPAARLNAIERELREGWQSRVPAREVHFGTVKYPLNLTRDTMTVVAKDRQPIVVDWQNYDRSDIERVRTARLDDDLAFIAWDVPLELPFDNKEEVFPQMLVLPVREAPFFGGMLTVSPETARLLGDGPYDDVTIASKLPLSAKFGAYCLSGVSEK